MRAETLELMRQRDDSWLWQESEWGNNVFAKQLLAVVSCLRR